jgi:hypothetical protein
MQSTSEDLYGAVWQIGAECEGEPLPPGLFSSGQGRD